MTSEEIRQEAEEHCKETLYNALKRIEELEKENVELKDEMKNKISMALKDPILQQGFEIICNENEQIEHLREERNYFQEKCEDIELNYYCDHKGGCKVQELEKANKWHYVKDGDLPKDTTSLYLVRVYSWNFSFSHLYKKYTTYIPTVCEWSGEYFKALDDMAYYNARNIKNCIAWKEIVLPEIKESE